MTEIPRRQFLNLQVDDLNRVNDAQKSKWAAISKRGGEELRQNRIRAYFLRWKEALVYAMDGDMLLDIGGGYIPDDLITEIVERHHIFYHLVDIDPKVISAAQRQLAILGLPSDHARNSDNTNLPFPENAFDFIFSSHAMEHSVDIVASFREIRRVLRARGSLFFAVPIGFDAGDEHNYFLGMNEWAAITEAAGFEILNVHIGKVYPYSGWDLAIIARKIEAGIDWGRIGDLSARFSKSAKVFVHHTDAAFRYTANAEMREGGAVLLGVDSTCTLAAIEPISALLLYNYSWAGIVEVANATSRRIVDCYSRFHYISALDLQGMHGPYTISVLGRNALSRDAQGCIYGMLLDSSGGR